jgi:hypothetical protein
VAIDTRTQAILSKTHLEFQLSDLIHGLRDVGANLDKGTKGYAAEHELAMLRAALQGAVTLEFATLPPYLSAIWSVKDELHPVARSLREILQEEMLHMALACNMLAAIGGRPEIKTAVPTYPGKLPLNVHPELTVPLSGLSAAALGVFMEIERPKHAGHFESLKAGADLQSVAKAEGGDDRDDITIGELYDGILAAFQRQTPALSTERQITGPLAWFVVKDLGDVERAIETIETQGEGSVGSPDSGAGNHAHYYRFAEILERKKLVQDAGTGQWAFETPFPLDMAEDVWPVGEVPDGGYTDDEVEDPEVRRLSRGFNLIYSRLLDLLDSAWKNEGGQASFWHAIETMFALEAFGRPLMQIARPDGKNYGPDFRYVPQDER